MSANFEQKKLVVEEIKDKISRAKSMVFVDYRGINVAEDTKLRADFRKADVDYKVYKNKLFALALKELNITGLDDVLQDTTAIAFGYSDEVAPAKILKATSKEIGKLNVKAGYLNGKAITADEVKSLADLPSKEQLVAKLLGVLSAPATGLVTVLNAPIKGLAVALNAIATK